MAKKSRQTDPGALIDGLRYLVEVTTMMPRWRSSDSQELGFLPLLFVQNVSGEPSRRGHLGASVEAKRRTHRLVPEPANSESAERLIMGKARRGLEVQADPNRHGGAVPCA